MKSKSVLKALLIFSCKRLGIQQAKWPYLLARRARNLVNRNIFACEEFVFWLTGEVISIMITLLKVLLIALSMLDGQGIL